MNRRRKGWRPQSSVLKTGDQEAVHECAGTALGSLAQASSTGACRSKVQQGWLDKVWQPRLLSGLTALLCWFRPPLQRTTTKPVLSWRNGALGQFWGSIGEEWGSQPLRRGLGHRAMVSRGSLVADASPPAPPVLPPAAPCPAPPSDSCVSFKPRPAASSALSSHSRCSNCCTQ